MKRRGLRTLDLFLTTLLDGTGGVLPPNFVVTLPKITAPEQVAALAAACDELESRFRLSPGIAAVRADGRDAAVDFRPGRPRRAAASSSRAGSGRVIGAHFGTYDYTAVARDHRRASAHDCTPRAISRST